MKKIFTLALLMGSLSLSACGESEKYYGTPDEDGTVAVTVKGENFSDTFTTSCAKARKLCEALAQDEKLKPASPTAACTDIYGGRGTAVVKGSMGVFNFDRKDGCAIASWEALEKVAPPKLATLLQKASSLAEKGRDARGIG